MTYHGFWRVIEWIRANIRNKKEVFYKYFLNYTILLFIFSVFCLEIVFYTHVIYLYWNVFLIYLTCITRTKHVQEILYFSVCRVFYFQIKSKCLTDVLRNTLQIHYKLNGLRLIRFSVRRKLPPPSLLDSDVIKLRTIVTYETLSIKHILKL